MADKMDNTGEENQPVKNESGLAGGLSALNTAINAISSSLELPEILDRLKRQMVETFHVPGGVIFFYESGEGSLYLESAWGLPASILAFLRRLPILETHHRSLIETGEPFETADYRQVAIYRQAGLDAARPDWQGYLSVPLIVKAETQGVIDLFSLGPKPFSGEEIAIFAALGQQVGIMIQNARLFSQVRTSRQRLEFLSQQLLEVQENERRHIARELHDEIGQALTAIKVNLQAVLRHPRDLTNPRYLEDSIGIVEHLLQQVRDLSLDLRPSLLDDLGIVAALRWYLDRQGRRAGFKTEFLAVPQNMRLPADLETVCFRVVQEAMTNVVRHAVASQVSIQLIQSGTQLDLFIKDDGIGFNVAAIRDRSVANSSFGLLGMQERVELVGGQIEIRSDPSRGTEVHAIFRIPQA